MTLLRRAPREVYRVYSEQEFFADTTAHAEPADPASPASTERQLQRFAGATVLLVTVGVVGGMIVVSSVSSPAARRRGGARSSAASGSQPPKGDRVARMQASAGVLDAHERPVDRGDAAPLVGGRKQQAGSRRRTTTMPPHGSRPRGVVMHTVRVQGPTRVVLEANVGEPVSMAEPTTRTAVAAPQPVQAEFGFER